MAFLLHPTITTVLLFVVFHKAGFSWPMACLSLGPIIASVLPYGLNSLNEAGYLFFSEQFFSIALLLTLVIYFLPLVILALRPWRRSFGAENNSETFK